MGRRRRAQGRRLDGILLLDKSPGESSNAALQAVKRLYRARKAGHTGSLDPLASGMLPICFGEATKLSGFLLDADKTYWVRARLGELSNTGDAEGEIIERRPYDHVDVARMEAVLADFLGEQEQIPPMYSAVKHQGKRLYELAREGVEVERKPRRIVLHELRLLRLEADEFELELCCSKGTYVRTLVEDIAKAMNTLAFVLDLRRLQVGSFEEAGMVTFAELEDAFWKDAEMDIQQRQALIDTRLLPLDHALSHWPAVSLDADSAYYLQRGQAVQVPQAPTSGFVRIYDARENFLGVGEVQEDGRIGPRRMMQESGREAKSAENQEKK